MQMPNLSSSSINLLNRWHPEKLHLKAEIEFLLAKKSQQKALSPILRLSTNIRNSISFHFVETEVLYGQYSIIPHFENNLF